MTFTLSFDPGLMTGGALGYYDATTPYQLLDRYQIPRGLDGFITWASRHWPDGVNEIIVEKFTAMRNDFVANIDGVPIEGVIAWLAHERGIPVIWQTRSDKARLVPYPPEANTVKRRQSYRFKWLEAHGLRKKGTAFDDSNDAITHALIYLKARRHRPTLEFYWPRQAGTVE